MVKNLLVTVIRFTTLAITSLLVSAAPTQAKGNDWILCDIQTHKVEREEGIPAYLLKSISLAETGRWDKKKRVNFAWPWTVTALGVGNYFQNKDKALKYLHFLQANAITNIDVGCMQVNLHYHGNAFASLEDALDPAINIAYAAKYLKKLYQSAHSWTKAAGFYHSKTPKYFQRYKLKVLKYWKQQNQHAGLENRKAVNHQHMAKLNSRYKQQKQKAQEATPTNIHSLQLKAWRNGDKRSYNMTTLAKIRRAYKSAQWQKKYSRDLSNKTSKNFSDKRRSQLNKWRNTRAPSKMARSTLEPLE